MRRRRTRRRTRKGAEGAECMQRGRGKRGRAQVCRFVMRPHTACAHQCAHAACVCAFFFLPTPAPSPSPRPSSPPPSLLLLPSPPLPLPSLSLSRGTTSVCPSSPPRPSTDRGIVGWVLVGCSSSSAPAPLVPLLLLSSSPPAALLPRRTLPSHGYHIIPQIVRYTNLPPPCPNSSTAHHLSLLLPNPFPQVASGRQAIKHSSIIHIIGVGGKQETSQRPTGHTYTVLVFEIPVSRSDQKRSSPPPSPVPFLGWMRVCVFWDLALIND